MWRIILLTKQRTREVLMNMPGLDLMVWTILFCSTGQGGQNYWKNCLIITNCGKAKVVMVLCSQPKSHEVSILRNGWKNCQPLCYLETPHHGFTVGNLRTMGKTATSQNHELFLHIKSIPFWLTLFQNYFLEKYEITRILHRLWRSAYFWCWW